MVALNTEV